MGQESRKKKNLCKSLYQTGAAVAMAALLFHPFVPAEAWATDTIPEKIDINIQATCPDIADIKADKKKVVAFNHILHAEKYLIGKSAYSQNPYTDEFTCAACHLGSQAANDIIATDKCDRQATAISAAGGGKKYKKLMHGMCIDCHKKMKKAQEATGPTSCKACHS